MIKVGSDFSGVGAFNQALIRLGIEHEEVFACDMDKFARHTFIHNYGEPKYYPENVYDREIPEESLDIYMTSPPCQAFSLAGKRKGKDDERGILFFNSHEFIVKNKPRYFIFENVKGLLSTKNGLTFENSLYLCLYNFKKIEEWQSLNTQKNNLNLLSQTLAPYLYMNWSKKLGLKKTKSGTSFISNSELNFEKLENIVKSGLMRRSKFLEERIYQITKKSNYYQKDQIVQFGCKEEDLVLNQNKLYLIENLLPMVTSILEKTVNIQGSISLWQKNLLEDNSKKGKWYTMLTELNSTIDPRIFMYVLELNIIRLIILALDLSLNLWKEIWLILTGKKAFTGLKTFDEWLFNLDHLNYHIYWKVLNAKNHGVPQNRERVFIVGIRDDQDNVFSWPKEEPLEKRLKDILEPKVDQKYFLSEKSINQLLKNGTETDHLIPGEVSNTIRVGGGGSLSSKHSFDMIKVIGNTDPSGNGMNGNVFDSNGLSPTLSTNKGEGVKCCIPVLTPDRLNKRQNGRRFKDDGDPSFTISTQDRHGVLIDHRGHKDKEPKEINDGISPCLRAESHGHQPKWFDGYTIRRLTPRECFRLMDFPDSFTWPVSDSQAYKQAGNSIVVKMLELIISKFRL